MKRARGLTGGTGDINPQWMSFSEVQTGNDTATSGAIQPPVSLSTGENLVMEILRIYIEWENPLITSGTTTTLNFWVSTKNFGTTAPTLGLGDATVVILSRLYGLFTTSGIVAYQQPQQYDMTDGAGHGVLVGNQNLYWGITSAGTSQANRVSVKVLYRAKRISQSELLGIVLQSNQN